VRLRAASWADPGRRRLALCGEPAHDGRPEAGNWGIPVEKNLTRVTVHAMPKLLLAGIICISAASLCFYVLDLANVPREFSVALATSILTLVQYVHQALQKESGSVGFAALPRGIVPLPQYDLRWHEALVYPTFVFLGVWNALSFIVGLILGAALAEAELTLEMTRVSGTMLFVSAMVGTITSYHIGVWVGTRYTCTLF
jgi:hypothetical protein